MVRSIARRFAHALASAALGLVLVGAAFYVHFLRSGPPLEPWHRLQLPDFTADRASEVQTLEAYRRLEEGLFAELLDTVYVHPDPSVRVPFNRYHAGSLSDPGTWPVDWNRTFHLPAPGTPRSESSPGLPVPMYSSLVCPPLHFDARQSRCWMCQYRRSW